MEFLSSFVWPSKFLLWFPPENNEVLIYATWWTKKSRYSYNWYFKNCTTFLNFNLLCVCARSLKVEYINDHSKVGPTTTNDAWCELIFWQWGQRIFILHRYLHYYVVGRPDQLFFLQFIFSCLQFTCTWSSS